MMQADIDKLYHATEGKIGTNEKAVIDILCHRSWQHLKALNVAYINRSKHKWDFYKVIFFLKSRSTQKVIYSKVIGKETSGHFSTALMAIMHDPVEWHAKRIVEAAKGLGTNDRMFTSNIMLPNQW